MITGGLISVGVGRGDIIGIIIIITIIIIIIITIIIIIITIITIINFWNTLTENYFNTSLLTIHT